MLCARSIDPSNLPTDQPPALPDASPALAVSAAFHGVPIGARLLSAPGRGRRRTRPRGQTSYLIGDTADSDAPAPIALLGARNLPLVSTMGRGFVVNVTPGMTGDVQVGGKVYCLADYVAERGTRFALPDQARARIDCGAMSFRLAPTPAVPALPRRWLDWTWQEQKFTLGSLFALAIVLALAWAAPPDESSISGDLMAMGKHFAPILVTPPSDPPLASDAAVATPSPLAGRPGQAHQGPAGAMGRPKARPTNGAYAVAGDGVAMHTGGAAAAAAARRAGILGILDSRAASPFSDVFGRGLALGDAPENVLGNLIGNEVAESGGVGGLGTTGSGAGGGGFGEKTLGEAGFATLGGAGPHGYGRASDIAGLRTHVTRPPAITPGICNVRGSLDKEIVRRVVRLHMNEVKYCYDKQLVKNAALEGRIAVQFVISPAGQVLSSVLQSTTMADLHVEKCVVDAVKRWEFPKPQGGGIVIVSYPFSFVAGSGR